MLTVAGRMAIAIIFLTAVVLMLVGCSTREDRYWGQVSQHVGCIMETDQPCAR